MFFKRVYVCACVYEYLNRNKRVHNALFMGLFGGESSLNAPCLAPETHSLLTDSSSWC